MNAASSPALTPHQAAAVADEAEALAFADLYAAAVPALQAQLGLRVAQVADARLLLAPRLPTSMFNRVIGLGLQRPAGVADVAAIVREYHSAGCATWWLHWNPYSVPADLAAALPGMSFTVPARRSWAKVLRGTQAAPEIATDLQVAPVKDSQADAVVQAIVAAFEMPPFMAGWLRSLHGRRGWRMYAACDGPQVVGGGCLFTSGELAWLGMGAVSATHRRRGGQGALMARRIDDAIALGAQHIVTETGEPVGDEPNPSLANMKRCGFVTVASRLNFAGPAQ